MTNIFENSKDNDYIGTNVVCENVEEDTRDLKYQNLDDEDFDDEDFEEEDFEEEYFEDEDFEDEDFDDEEYDFDLIEIGSCALSYYLKKREDESSDYYWKRYPQLLDTAITAEEYKDMWNKVRGIAKWEMDMDSTLYPESVLLSGIVCLVKYFYSDCQMEVGDLGVLCLSLSAIKYVYPGVGKLYSDISNNGNQGANVNLASLLYYDNESLFGTYNIVAKVINKLELLFLGKYPVNDIYNMEFNMDRRLMSYIYGVDNPKLMNPVYFKVNKKRDDYENINDEKIEGFNDFSEKVFFNEKLDSVISRYALQVTRQPESVSTIILQGKSSSGRKYMAARIGDRLGRDILYVDVRYIISAEAMIPAVRHLFRELLLSNRIVCITGIEKEDDRNHRYDVGRLLNIIIDEYSNFPVGKRPLIITVSESVRVASLIHSIVIIENLPIPDMALSEEIWDYYQKKYWDKKILNASELASKMRLLVGQIEHIIKMLYQENPSGKEADKLVYKLCYKLLDDGRFDGIKRVDITETLEDIQLPEEQKDIIRMICAQVSGRMKVMNEWNLKSTFGYGTSTSVLFAGPPGTGKTMAARIVAGTLGLELYQIDLSQVVDKYVGETEKKLEDIFNKAAQSNMVLFFDEADALIGKRSEVKDSNDKYANVEVAYLLQRMEQYDGIVIMATNYMTNLDPALLRRIRFVVRFQMPDAITREKIWKGAIPREMPVEEIDFEYLGENFEFSGAQIKNTILNASFMAAADTNSKGLGMEHIIKACKLEITKEKTANFSISLGKYAYLG